MLPLVGNGATVCIACSIIVVSWRQRRLRRLAVHGSIGDAAALSDALPIMS